VEITKKKTYYVGFLGRVTLKPQTVRFILLFMVWKILYVGAAAMHYIPITYREKQNELPKHGGSNKLRQ
jgi:hypothetical protein